MRRRIVLGNLAASVAVIVSGACGDQLSPAAPTDYTAPLELPTSVDTTPIRASSRGTIVMRTRTLRSDIVLSQTITPEGGWLALVDVGLYVYFPSGAVTEPLQVTVTAHKGDRVVYTFEPHGTHFQAPVYIVQVLRHTTLNVSRNRSAEPWYGYTPNGLADVHDDGTGDFAEVFSARYRGTGNAVYAVGTTTHFSGYALASGRREQGNQNQQ